MAYRNDPEPTARDRAIDTIQRYIEPGVTAYDGERREYLLEPLNPDRLEQLIESDPELADPAAAAIITLADEDGYLLENTDKSVILYYPQHGRSAVVTNAYTTWADSTGSLEADAEMWVNDPQEWERRN